MIRSRLHFPFTYKATYFFVYTGILIIAIVAHVGMGINAQSKEAQLEKTLVAQIQKDNTSLDHLAAAIPIERFGVGLCSSQRLEYGQGGQVLLLQERQKKGGDSDEPLGLLPSSATPVFSGTAATNPSCVAASLRASQVLPAARSIFIVTAYCPCRVCCGMNTSGITASGKLLHFPMIAAPDWIQFGIVLKVPGYGIAVVEDRGGKIKDNRLDVFFPTHREAHKWGRKILAVEYLGNEQEIRWQQ